MPGLAAPAPPPLQNLYLYTTDECNLACRHCWVTARRRPRAGQPAVPVALYRTILEQAVALGLTYVKISGGEALLRRDDVLELVELTCRLKVATRLETNGTLIDAEVADTLRRTSTAVSISLDGASAQVHEAIRRVPGSFERTMAAFDLLRERRVPVELVFSLHRNNYGDIDGVLRIASTLPGARLKINPIIASGRGRIMARRGELLTVRELQELIRGVERRYRTFPVPVSVTAEPAFYGLDSIWRQRAGGGRCGFKSLLGILADGSVSFCGMGYRHSDYVFGAAADVDLATLWRESPKLLEVRRQVPDQLQGICGNCVLKHVCQGGCRSNAFDVYGSITAPTPNCQRLYEEGLFPATRMIEPGRAAPYPRDDGDGAPAPS